MESTTGSCHRLAGSQRSALDLDGATLLAVQPHAQDSHLGHSRKLLSSGHCTMRSASFLKPLGNLKLTPELKQACTGFRLGLAAFWGQ